MPPNHIKFIWFGDIDAPEPYEFIGPGGFDFGNTGMVVDYLLAAPRGATSAKNVACCLCGISRPDF